MKKYLILSGAAVLSLSACNTPKGATSGKYSDDIYYSSADAAAEKEKQQLKSEQDRRTK